MKKVILAIAVMLTISGCTKAELKCDKSCDVTRDAEGKTTYNCSTCTLEVEGREDLQLLDVSLPTRPDRD